MVKDNIRANRYQDEVELGKLDQIIFSSELDYTNHTKKKKLKSNQYNIFRETRTRHTV